MLGTAKAQSTAAADRFHCWTTDMLARDPHPTIEYKKELLNLVANSLSRLGTGEYYDHNFPLQNTKAIILKKKAEVFMVITLAKTAEQEKTTPKLPDLQIKVRDIFKMLDKHQLIMKTEKVFDLLEPATLRELQNKDQSIINLKNSRKQCMKADKDNILRMKINHKGQTMEAILLPKVFRPWIITSTHELCGHQGDNFSYYSTEQYTSGME